MAIHTELAIYKASYDLLGVAVDAVSNMRRYRFAPTASLATSSGCARHGASVPGTTSTAIALGTPTHGSGSWNLKGHNNGHP